MSKSRPSVSGVPVAYINAILLAFQRYKLSPLPALTAAQIPAESLLDAANRISPAQMEAFCANAMQTLDDEALGWFSRRLPWGSYGMLCRASLTAPNLGIALKRWCRHHRLLVDDIELTITVDGKSACVAIQVNRDLAGMTEFCLVTSLRYLLGYACWVIDSGITLWQAEFPFAEPGHASIYPRLFSGPVRFGAARAAIYFDAQYLQLPLRRDEPALRQMLERAIPLTVLPYRRDRLLARRIRQILRSKGNEASTATTLAAQLHISERTLHRLLKEESTSLQQLKDEARRERAQDLLNRSKRPIKQIALASGFRNEKSFTRAFRKWTGMSPLAYRDQATQTAHHSP